MLIFWVSQQTHIHASHKDYHLIRCTYHTIPSCRDYCKILFYSANRGSDEDIKVEILQMMAEGGQPMN